MFMTAMSFPIWEALNTCENDWGAHRVALEYKIQMGRGPLTRPADLLWDIGHFCLFFFPHDHSSDHPERQPTKSFLLIISRYFSEVCSDSELNKPSMLWEHQFKPQVFTCKERIHCLPTTHTRFKPWRQVALLSTKQVLSKQVKWYGIIFHAYVFHKWTISSK